MFERKRIVAKLLLEVVLPDLYGFSLASVVASWISTGFCGS